MTIPSFYELQQRRAISHLGLDPFPWYKQMRMTDPVSVNEQDQLCELFRYADIQAVLADPLLFSSKSLLGEDEEWAKRGSILASDPPYHNKLRALVSQAFTPRAIAKNADKIRSIVNELLDAGTTSGTLEVIQDLAAPLPLRVIAEMMGVPFEHQDNLKRWVRQGLVEGISPEQASVNLLAFEDYMRTLLAQKREERQDDLISALLDAQVDGELLSEQEIVYFCTFLFGAGFATTEHLISNTLLCLDEHPSARSQLWADPSLALSTIEEVLRFRPAGPRNARIATRDTQIGGKQIRAGYRVFSWLASANCDEEQWSDPEVFDIRRSPNRHLGLGSGIHACLGAPLARLEVKIVLEQLIERFKDIQRVQEVPLQLVESLNVYGVQQLPMHVYKR